MKLSVPQQRVGEDSLFSRNVGWPGEVVSSHWEGRSRRLLGSSESPWGLLGSISLARDSRARAAAPSQLAHGDRPGERVEELDQPT